MAKPGIMVYFDVLEPLRLMSNEDRGRLFLAMLEYGQYGVVPEFEGVLAIVWGFVAARLEADDQRYNMTVLKKQYANYCKKAKEGKISFEEWRMIPDRDQMEPGGTTWNPTTESTTAADSASDSTTITISSQKANTTSSPKTQPNLYPIYAQDIVDNPVE